MNDEQLSQSKQAILFASIIRMISESRQELEGLQKTARQTYGNFYTIEPGYWGSSLELEINTAVANINYCYRAYNSSICLN
jgi:hypothetical protein